MLNTKGLIALTSIEDWPKQKTMITKITRDIHNPHTPSSKLRSTVGQEAK